MILSRCNAKDCPALLDFGDPKVDQHTNRRRWQLARDDLPQVLETRQIFSGLGQSARIRPTDDARARFFTSVAHDSNVSPRYRCSRLLTKHCFALLQESG